ncbi:MAG: hypothetical protein FWF77_07260 [Defluviitaleaceae bacterium]|nr:hypothetical protein [Defluviitaleaceae bacterium]
MSESAHSLEAGSNFPDHKKRVGECHSPTLFCVHTCNLTPTYKKYIIVLVCPKRGLTYWRCSTWNGWQ